MTLSFINITTLYKEYLHSSVGILNLAFFLLIPGYLITKLLNINGKLGEIIGYSVVLSISFLIFIGLAINNILPLFAIMRPLETIPFLIGADIGLFVILILLYIHTEKIKFQFDIPKLNLLSKAFIFIAFLFPVVMLTGTNLLNNGGSNVLVFSVLIGIVIYTLQLILFRKYIHDSVFPISIFFIGLSLLWMYSWRTPFLMGWDIQTEYKVYLLTKEQYQWTVLNYHNAYNATLGVTILPTLLSNLSTIKDIYIFKLVYPFLFAFSGIGTYYLLHRYLSRTAAYLASFFFIIQMSYASMPSLARQEIGYLCFIYLILSLFDYHNKKLHRNTLFLILGCTVVVTHYTTTYIMVGLFIVTYILSKIIQLFFRIVTKFKPNWIMPAFRFNLHGVNVVLLLLLTIFWYGIYTNASANIQNFGKSVFDNISKVQTQEGRSGQSWITINGKQRSSTMTDLEAFEAFNKRNEYGYPESITSRYPVLSITSAYVPYSATFKQYPETIGLYSRHAMKALIIMGLLFVMFQIFIKKKKIVEIEWLILACLYLFLIIMAIFIPKVSGQYNMERLYQQGLIFLVFFPVFFIKSVFTKLSHTIKYVFILTLFSVYFFSYHGVIIQMFGGLPTMNLNNFGNEYDQYYIHESELKSAKWLDQNREIDNFIHADSYAELRLSSGTNISNVQTKLLPSSFWQKSYIYGTEENVLRGKVQANFNSTSLVYNFPLQFLNDNKDVVYSNKKSIIYK